MGCMQRPVASLVCFGCFGWQHPHEEAGQTYLLDIGKVAVLFNGRLVALGLVRSVHVMTFMLPCTGGTLRRLRPNLPVGPWTDRWSILALLSVCSLFHEPTIVQVVRLAQRGRRVASPDQRLVHAANSLRA